jgi:hypothetical protein
VVGGLAIKAALVLALGAGPATYRAQVERPPDHVGYAVRYRPRKMDETANHRHIAPERHMVSYTYAKDRDMGKLRLHIKGPGGEMDALVVDLPRPGKDKANLVRRDVVVELAYEDSWLCPPGWQGRAVECQVEVWVLK